MRKTKFAITARNAVALARKAPRAAVEQLVEDLRDVLAAQKTAPQGTYVQEMVNCGKLKCRSCKPGGKGSHGPYWYYYWVENHKTRKRYIGKELPEGVDHPEA